MKDYNIKDITSRLIERAKWLESRSFAELHGDIEREAADIIQDLWKRLLRANTFCEDMHHDKHEYHTDGECPVEKWVRKGMDN